MLLPRGVIGHFCTVEIIGPQIIDERRSFMYRQEQRHNKLLYLLLVILIASVVGGCPIKLVADYDANTFEETVKLSKKVDLFYGNLLEIPEPDRQYKKFAEKYVEIQSDMRSLVTRNQARPLNLESTKISETILDLWVKYKDNHQAKDGYSNGTAKLDRKRFIRLFNAAAAAEAAKKLEADDRDVAKDSKDAK